MRSEPRANVFRSRGGVGSECGCEWGPLGEPCDSVHALTHAHAPGSVMRMTLRSPIRPYWLWLSLSLDTPPTAPGGVSDTLPVDDAIGRVWSPTLTLPCEVTPNADCDCGCTQGAGRRGCARACVRACVYAPLRSEPSHILTYTPTRTHL